MKALVMIVAFRVVELDEGEVAEEAIAQMRESVEEDPFQFIDTTDVTLQAFVTPI